MTKKPESGSTCCARRLAAAAASVLFLFPLAARGHDFGDDHGDGPTNARPMNLNSNCSGRIEIDTDRDWFSFTAAATQKYTVAVATGTLWDSTLTVVAPDMTTMTATTDSVFAATSSISWIHFGPPATYYVGVGGFAQFTTGTYSVVATRSSFPDIDHDGMDDSWETASFQSTSQPASGDYDGDGMSNLDEFLAGTNPADPLSGLRITGVAIDGSGASIACQVQPNRYYRLNVSTNPAAPVWQPMELVTNLLISGTRTFSDTNAPGSSPRYYRVKCVF